MAYSTAFVLHKSSNGGLGATTTTVKSNSSGEIVLDNSAEGQPWQKEIRRDIPTSSLILKKVS